MPKKPFDQITIRQKKNLFRICCELFSQNGYAHTSVKMITKRLRVADGYLYYYFDGKKDLAKWAIEWGNDIWWAHYQKHVDKKNPSNLASLFKAIVAQNIRFINEHREIFGAYNKLVNEPNFPLAEWMTDQISWLKNTFEQMVKLEIASQNTRTDIPPDLIVMSLEALNTRIQEFYYHPHLDPIGLSEFNEQQLEEFIEQVISLLFNGIGNKPLV